MYLINVIGMTGQGKSPFIHEYISNRKCFVNDVNDEYGQRTKYEGQTPIWLSDNINDERARYTGMDKETFCNIAMKKTNTIVVVEDATAFFRGAQTEKTMLMVTRKLFNRNTYIFAWHSINRVPPFFFELSNYCVLFKTNDQDNNVMRKYASIYPYYEKLKSMPPQSKLIIKLMEQ
jgi:hypothetical protein